MNNLHSTYIHNYNLNNRKDNHRSNSVVGSMKMRVKESIMVKPREETPRGSVWLSNLDLVFPNTYHTRWMYLYRWDGGAGFFDNATLKAALSRALVEFYPYAGRLRKAEKGS